jgi:hypothetical protein
MGGTYCSQMGGGWVLACCCSAPQVSSQMGVPHKRLYSNQDALRWMIQIAEALEYLHGANPIVSKPGAGRSGLKKSMLTLLTCF